MNKDKKVTIGEGGLTPRGNGATVWLQYNRDAETPLTCILLLASSRVLCLPA